MVSNDHYITCYSNFYLWTIAFAVTARYSRCHPWAPSLSVLGCMLTLNQCLFFFHFIFDLGLMGWRVKTQTGNNTVKRKYVHEQNKVFIIQCIYFKNLPKYHTLQNKSLKIKSCYIWNQMHKCLDKFCNLQIKVSKWEICIFSLGLCAGPLFYLML